MSGFILHQLTEETAPSGTDIVYVEGDPGGGQLNRKTPIASLGGDFDRLASGEAVMRRRDVTSSMTMFSQAMRLAFFTARKTEPIASVRMMTHNTAAGATPSLVRVGIYSVAANGDLTLVASTPNDTALLAAANTVYTKALSSSFSKVAGVRYAVGLLVVTTATAPTVPGSVLTLVGSEMGLAPRIAGTSSNADLPSSVTNGSLSASGNTPYFALVP